MEQTNFKSATTENVLQDLVKELKNNEIPAVQNARIVLAKALWLDIPQQTATQLILESVLARHFRNNPHLLPELWDEVSGILQPNQELTELQQTNF
jgi:hypothetical protein